MISLIRTYFIYVFFFFLMVMTFSFFFSIAVNSILIPVFFTLFIIDLKKILKSWSEIRTTRNILLLLIFLSLFISVLYSDDKKRAFSEIFSALPLIALPVSLTHFNRLSEKKIIWLKRFYIFCCIAATIIALTRAVFNSGLLDGSYKQLVAPNLYDAYFVHRFTYHKLGANLHAIYFSMYVALSIYLILAEIRGKARITKMLWTVLLLYLLIFLILLKSITINFALYSSVVIYFYFIFSFKKWQHYFLFFSISLAGAFVTGYLYLLKHIDPNANGIYLFDSPELNKKILAFLLFTITGGFAAIIVKIVFRNKYIPILSAIVLITTVSGLIYISNRNIFATNNNTSENQRQDNVTVRYNYWNSALDVIKDHPLLGVGIGDKKLKLLKQNTGNSPDSSDEHTFNPHNQFLDYWISAGIIPLLCFILFLANEFSIAWRNKHFIYLGLVYCFTLFCFTDIAMTGQRGQVFFLFFICLFGSEIRKKNKTEPDMALPLPV